MATKTELLRELEGRLSRLRCVSAFTRMVAVGFAQDELTADQIRWYLAHSLPVVERFIEPIDELEFRELCDRMCDVLDLATLADEFGMAMDFNGAWWALANFHAFGREDAPHTLAALANHFALPDPDPYATPLLWGCLANLSSILGRYHYLHAGAEVYELLLGCGPSIYRSRNAVRELLRERLPDRFLFVQAVYTLADELQKSGRLGDAEQVLLAALGVRDGESPSPDATSAALVALLAEPSAFEAEMGEHPGALAGRFGLVAGVAQGLRAGHPVVAAACVERFVGCVPGSASPAEVARRLIGRGSDPVTRHVVHLILMIYAQILNVLDREEDSVSVIEAALGLHAEVYRNPDRLTLALAGLREATRLDGDLYLAGVFTTSLRRVGRAADAVAFTESLLAEPSTGDRFARALAGWRTRHRNAFSADHAIGLLAGWARSLAEAGRNEEARRLLMEALGDLDWLAVRDGRLDGSIMNLITGVSELFIRVVPHDLGFGVALTRAFLLALRATAADTRIPPSDRKRFQEGLGEIRQEIVRMGHRWVAATSDRGERQDRWVETLAWDAELGQRVVLERFLEGAPSSPVGPPPRLPPLVASATTPDSASSRGFGSFCFDSHTEASPAPLITAPMGEPPPEAESLARHLADGITPAHLARGLLSSERLLRAGFAPDGRLVWGLLARDGDQLRLLADGIGSPTDRAAVASAARRHDAELKLVWFPGRLASRTDWPAVFEEPARRLRGEELFALKLAVRESPGDAADHWEAFLGELSKTIFAECVSRLREAYAGFFDPPSPDTDTAIWIAERGSVVDRLALLLSLPDNAATARRRLDSPTESFLRSVSRVWSLDAAAGFLRRDCDLLIQVDDTLHAVPIPYLPVGAKFLCETVGSTRCVLSAVLNGWLAGMERGRPIDSGSGRGLVLSWFGPTDGARAGAAQLRRELAASVGGWDWQDADGATGSHATLTGAVGSSSPPRVVVVCGHGHDSPTGVSLGDGVWGGSRLFHRNGNVWQEAPGCNLAGVEFLIQVSCSIGRVGHGADQDVDGFCVEVAVARGRSVLAGKWPIDCLESPVFAAQVAAEYRQLRDTWAGGAVSDGCLRARAVAAARRALGVGPTSRVGLNTAAAFELYGLG